MRKSLALLFILAVVLTLVPQVDASPQIASGDISFQRSILENVHVQYVEEFFRFRWLGNTFDLKLSMFVDGKFHSLKDFVKDNDVRVKDVINIEDWSLEFGYLLYDIPQDIADNTDFLIWEIESPSFNIDEIELISYEHQPKNITALPYTVTEVCLPDNLILSYEDLSSYGFSVSHPSKLKTRVDGVKGKTSLDLDPIAYSSPIITVTGNYTSLHWELWNASNSNGWNVVHKQGEAHYLINNTYVKIGDDSTSTACSDKSVNVLFETNQRYGYVIEGQASLTFGQQDSGYATSHGVNVNFNDSFGWGRFFFGSGGELSLYSCSLKSTHTDNPDDVYYGEIGYFSNNLVQVYNCLFEKVSLGIGSNYDVYNLAILRGLYGLGRCQGSFNQLFLYDLTYLIVPHTTQDSTFSDVNIITVDALSKIRYVGASGGILSHYFINVNWTGANDWSFYWHDATPTSLFRQYEFDLTFCYGNGSLAQGTNVTITNAYLDSSVSWVLGSNGSIPQQTLSMGHYNQTGGDVLYDYNPYVVTATLDGFQTYSQVLNVTQKEAFTIALQPAVTNWLGVVIILFVICVLLLVCGLCSLF